MLPRARLASERQTSTLTLTPDSLPGTNSNNSGLNRWESEKKKPQCQSNSWKYDFYVAILSFTIDSASWIHLMQSCLSHGGAAYLIARVASIIFVGIPLLFFETSIGQLSGMGPWKFFSTGNLRAVFSGVGVFLLINSVYKAVRDSASAMWPVSETITLLVGVVEGLNGTVIDKAVLTIMQGFTHLDPLTVISLSVTWIFGVLTVICGLRFISKVSYVMLGLPVVLITSFICLALHAGPTTLFEGLAVILSPKWEMLLSLPMWAKAVTDTILSFNLGFGVIAFLASLSTHKFNCLNASVAIASLHTLTLGLMLVFGALSIDPGRLPVDHAEMVSSLATGIEDINPSEVWKICFFVTIFLLNIDALVFISNMLATSFSNLTWRPVLAVFIGAFLYVICLPLATRSRELYLEMIEKFTTDLLPVMGLFLMLVATVCSLRPNSVVDLFEFAAKWKLAFRGQSYVYVCFNILLPLLLAMCIVDGLVRMFTADEVAGHVMTIVGHCLLGLPWAAFLLTPLYVLACQYRDMPASKRWRELWSKSEYEDWLYRRPQMPGADGEDGSVSNSIYELPERVSSSRPISSYYSNATILASDSAVYSAYY